MCDHDSDQTIGTILTKVCIEAFEQKISIEFVHKQNRLRRFKIVNLLRYFKNDLT